MLQHAGLQLDRLTLVCAGGWTWWPRCWIEQLAFGIAVVPQAAFGWEVVIRHILSVGLSRAGHACNTMCPLELDLLVEKLAVAAGDGVRDTTVGGHDCTDAMTRQTKTKTCHKWEHSVCNQITQLPASCWQHKDYATLHDDRSAPVYRHRWRACAILCEVQHHLAYLGTVMTSWW